MSHTSNLAETVSQKSTVAISKAENTERPVAVMESPTDKVALKNSSTAPVSTVAELNSRVFKLPSTSMPDLVHKLKKDHAQPLTIALLSLSVGVLLWYLASEFNFNWFINFENVPGPGGVFMAFIGHMQTEIFYTHIGVSLRRILISYSLAVILGVCIGVLMGRSRLVKQFLMPYIEVVRPIPAVAWIPLAILMWPTEESSIIYITFLGALFPIVLNTLHGVEQTPEVLVRASQSLGASRWGIFRHVVLPGALPSIAAGLAIGMGVSWFSLLAGEIISGQYGIGYFTWNAYSLINYQDIVVGMLVIGFLGTACTVAIKLITRPMLHWQKRIR